MKNYEQFITEVKREKKKGMKYIEFTGSPKSAGFSTKAVFLDALKEHGFDHGSMTKRDNIVDILCTNTPNSTTNKMKLAAELGVEIMTYEEMVDIYDLVGDLN